MLKLNRPTKVIKQIIKQGKLDPISQIPSGVDIQLVNEQSLTRMTVQYV